MFNKYNCPYFSNMSHNNCRYAIDEHKMYRNSCIPNIPNYDTHNKKSKGLKSLMSTLDEMDFIVQEGHIKYIDILKLCSEGIVDSCLAQNVGAPYASCILPAAPEQETYIELKNEGSGKYPQNINYIAPGVTYKLRPDEAIILIGITPPEAYYFGFRSYVGFVENQLMKSYSDAITAGNENTGYYHMIGASLGDTLNNYNIWTNNTPRGSRGNPFNSLTIIISTADKNINQQMRYALELAGYSADIMNNDNIPIELVNMGLEKGRDSFVFVMRVAKWLNPNIGNSYLDSLDKYWNILRITPKTALNYRNPWPVPLLRRKETCNTEFMLIPYIRKNFEHLRNEIVKKYAAEFEVEDLETDLWIMSNYESIVQDANILVDDRDALYLRTNNFQFTTDEDFVVVYGIDHSSTGKAVYYNSSLYGEDLLNGVAAVFSSAELKYPADNYFSYNNRNSKYFYSYKMGRANCKDCAAIVPYSTGNPQGKAFGVDNNQNVFLGFRLYLDHTTLVGPAAYDVVWDRAIMFRKKKV